ncbi:MAG: 2,3-bisphosphoglycerate-independent phosphoglycerate mutase [bacterium]
MDTTQTQPQTQSQRINQDPDCDMTETDGTPVSERHHLRKPIVLIVMDGWGHREDTKDNALATANTPRFREFWNTYPHTLLDASGLAVGLPEGQMGNSEIGHTTIGAGRAMDTDLVRIKKSIVSGEYDTLPPFVELFDHVKTNNSTLHVMGLLSDGGIHSHQDHLFAFIHAAKKAGVQKLAVHAFTDGRDVPPQSASKYIRTLQTVLKETGLGIIATISGRYYAMDRDDNADRLAKAEDVLFNAKGHVCEIDPAEYLENLYKEDKIDELLEPIVCKNILADGTEMLGDPIKEHDSIFFFNFRADRARQLTRVILAKAQAMDWKFAGMTSYGDEFNYPVVFPSLNIETTLAKEISKDGFTQAHIAETEKFPHATYFLNGGVEKPYPGESHILLASHKDVPTHDLAPKMRAEGIADEAIKQIEMGTDFIFINFANADMVGHTANVPAIIESVEEADKQLGRVVDSAVAKGGVVFITADHGNAELNIDQTTGNKHTSHTTSLVPMIVTDKEIKLRDKGNSPNPDYLGVPTLADIAPTIFDEMQIKKPDFMAGESLMVK